MKRAFLKYLYLANPTLFHEFMVEDLIGQVPKDIREPSVAFLAKGKDVLTRYFLYQAYIIQRRAVSDVDNAKSFHGMLVFIKFMMNLMADAQPRETIESAFVEEDKSDPLEGLNRFAEGMKKRTIKK